MNEMARTADVIAEEGDLTQRIPELESTARVAALARTLNRMIDRLEAGFERERRFFNEASHELRTPVTICRGDLEGAGRRRRSARGLRDGRSAPGRAAADGADTGRHVDARER